MPGTAPIAGGNVFVLPKRVPHAEESTGFLLFRASPASVWKWDVEVNNLPPVKAVAFD